MKKMMGLFFLCMLALVGCSQSITKEGTNKVGFVTGEGGIEDGSFSELTWNGIQEFTEEIPNVETNYVTPKDTSLSELVNSIDNLVMAGNQIIVVAGFAFEEAIGVSAKLYKDVDFILIDGEPLVDGNYTSLDNVLSIKFNEAESGFLAGAASALESKTGKVAHLGGIQVPAVEAYGFGFVSGVAYANAYFDTDVEVVDYVYSGTFTDFNVGQMLSAGMFDKGVDIILGTAGVATQGAIAEAKQRTNVFVVGCDSDQYTDGLQDDNTSVVLTSAMKHIDVAVKQELNNWLEGDFKGDKVTTMTIKEDGVGLPLNNPNLSENTIGQINEVIKVMKEGGVEIPTSKEDLINFLNQYDYDYSNLTF